MPAPRRHRRRAGPPRRPLGTAAAAGRGGAGVAHRLARDGVRRRRQHRDRCGLRYRARPARDTNGPQFRAQSEQLERHPLAQPAGNVSGRRASDDLARAPRRRGIVPPDAAEPSRGRRRLQPAKRFAVPYQSGAESVRHPEAILVVRSNPRAASRDCRRAFGRLVEPIAHVWPQIFDRHLRPGPRVRTGAARHHLSGHRLAHVFRDDGNSPARRPRVHAARYKGRAARRRDQRGGRPQVLPE